MVGFCLLPVEPAVVNSTGVSCAPVEVHTKLE